MEESSIEVYTTYYLRCLLKSLHFPCSFSRMEQIYHFLYFRMSKLFNLFYSSHQIAFPFLTFFIEMKKNNMKTISSINLLPIFVIRIFCTTDFYVHPQFWNVEVRCPYSWSTFLSSSCIQSGNEIVLIGKSEDRHQQRRKCRLIHATA